jgi:hypothetical protein
MEEMGLFLFENEILIDERDYTELEEYWDS